MKSVKAMKERMRSIMVNTMCNWFGHKWDYYAVGRHWQSPPHNEHVRDCKRCPTRETIGYDYDV